MDLYRIVVVVAASRIDGRQRRTLIMSACGKASYSVGRGTTPHELFSAAGFNVVAARGYARCQRHPCG